MTIIFEAVAEYTKNLMDGAPPPHLYPHVRQPGRLARQRGGLQHRRLYGVVGAGEPRRGVPPAKRMSSPSPTSSSPRNPTKSTSNRLHHASGHRGQHQKIHRRGPHRLRRKRPPLPHPILPAHSGLDGPAVRKTPTVWPITSTTARARRPLDEEGNFRLSAWRTSFSTSACPTKEEVKNRNYDEAIIRPFNKAVEEIESIANGSIHMSFDYDNINSFLAGKMTSASTRR